jgi:hypothetical protein
VRLGKPIVTSITPDSLVFINDARKFTIATYDSNGTVDSVKIDNGSGSFGLFVKTFNGFDTLNRVFARSEAGSKTIRMIAKDNDGLLSDTAKDTVVVRLAAPVINRVSIDTTGNNLFVNDVRKYSVSAHDTNGFVKKIYFSWNSAITGGAISDSIIILRNTASIDTFISHAYDTTMSGSRTVRTWAIDDDTAASSNKDTVVTVRLGRPVLWGDKGDTLWIMVNKDYGDYFYRPKYFDTNGVIDTFFFGATSTLSSATKGKADSAVLNIDASRINKGVDRYIWIKDNDDLIAGGTKFSVFADSAPPAPTVTSDAITGGRKISWSGKDAKDGDATLYKIIIKKTANPDENVDIVSDFKPGSQYASGAPFNDYSFSYTPTGGTGTYYYQIISKDARGSLSRCTVNNFNF